MNLREHCATFLSFLFLGPILFELLIFPQNYESKNPSYLKSYFVFFGEMEARDYGYLRFELGALLF